MFAGPEVFIVSSLLSQIDSSGHNSYVWLTTTFFLVVKNLLEITLKCPNLAFAKFYPCSSDGDCKENCFNFVTMVILQKFMIKLIFNDIRNFLLFYRLKIGPLVYPKVLPTTKK